MDEIVTPIAFEIVLFTHLLVYSMLYYTININPN